MTEPIKPDLFVVGAPKCGTTSMYRYLRGHPHVFMPSLKEPHFLAPDLEISSPPRVKDEATYLALFEAAGRCTRVGEASPFYLYSAEAPARIRAMSSDPRIIIMLRHPVDMMESLHLQYVGTGNEDILSFHNALAAGSDRAAGRRLPPHAQFPHCLDYTRMATFTPHVRRYVNAFGRDAVKVFLLDDLRSDGADVWRQVAMFLNVDHSYKPCMEPWNVRRPANMIDLRYGRWRRRDDWTGRMLRAVPAPVIGALRRVHHRLAPPRLPITMDADLRVQLTLRFAPEIERLARLLDRDLRAWYSPSPGSDSSRC